VAWYITGSNSASRQAEGLLIRAREQALIESSIGADRLGTRLEALREHESDRPFYHYQNLYHDPRGAAQGLSVTPSPLSQGPSDPLIWAHFQIDENGAVSLPTVSERFPELSTEEGFGHFCEVLGELQNGFVVARMDGDERGGNSTSGVGDDDEVITLDYDTWEQIRLADSVYASLTGRRGEGTNGRTDQASGVHDDVVIRVSPLRWHTIVLGSGPSLAALRQVTTPNGLLVQGIVIGAEGVSEWLGSGRVFQPTVSRDPGRIGVPVSTTDWFLVYNVTEVIRAVEEEGREIVRRFHGTFALTSAAALLAAMAVIAILAQTDRLARQRARFAAAAAHELKTPLTSLRLHGEMLAEGLGDPERWPTYASRMLPETSRLGRVVSNMLDLSRLERGAPLANPVEGDLSEAVGNCVNRIRPALEDAGVELTLEISEPLPRATFDRDALCQILDNLLDNAEKYTREEEQRAVTVRAHAAEQNVRVIVSDNGPGIDRRARHGLFRPFDRPSDPDAPAGLGLGLALARSLARAQGGDLRLLDGNQPGATFELTLPLSTG
jgi:signal transduction histidine kinase